MAPSQAGGQECKMETDVERAGVVVSKDTFYPPLTDWATLQW